PTCGRPAAGGRAKAPRAWASRRPNRTVQTGQEESGRRHDRCPRGAIWTFWPIPHCKALARSGPPHAPHPRSRWERIVLGAVLRAKIGQIVQIAQEAQPQRTDPPRGCGGRPSFGLLSSFRQDDRRARVSRICPISSLTSASDARSSRTDRGPFCLALPFRATRAFPSWVRGPVPCSQGRFSSAASRSLWRPCSVRGPRFFRFRRPAATLRGLGSFGASVVLTADPFATFTYQFAVRF